MSEKDIHVEERSGRPSVVSDDLVRNVDQIICERRRFTVSEHACKFSQISCAVFCRAIIIPAICTTDLPTSSESTTANFADNAAVLATGVIPQMLNRNCKPT
jgi:hypothetical protein